MADSKVLSFRVPTPQAAVVAKAARIRNLPPAEFIRRAVMRQVHAALLDDAVQEAGDARRLS
jgi:uncharacterized protein (DUF1778 family)